MLTIKRVPTVLSNYQEEIPSSGSGPAGCGRNCLGKCCLPFSKLPLYEFKAQREDWSNREKILPEEDAPIDFLNTLVLGQWEERFQRGLFRYDISACQSKVIPGNYGFIAQLNEGRHLKKRPTEFQVDRVLQPFDMKKFNFTKVGQEEVLFRFEMNADVDQSQYFEKAPVSATESPNVLAINVSPIDYGHVLLIPRVLDCLPQRIDPESFSLALHLAAEAGSPYFRLGYNSFGAFATINHLHFQAYYLSVPFPVEKSPMQRITMAGVQKGGVAVYRLMDYPVRGLVFEGGDTLQDLSDVASKACICLQENNIPFNVLISECGRRVFIFPQCYAEKQALGEVSQELLDTQVNPAVWEISGHIVLKRAQDYEAASEDYAWRLLAVVSLSEERFQEVMAYVFQAAGLEEAAEEDTGTEEALFQPPAPQATPHFPEECLVLQ